MAWWLKHKAGREIMWFLFTALPPPPSFCVALVGQATLIGTVTHPWHVLVRHN